MIMMIIIIMMIIMIIIIILYIFLFSSSSSCVTCFQKWHCDKCHVVFNFERNYHYHEKSCSGMNKYRCQDCGNVYNNKKSLHGHERKMHSNDVWYFQFFMKKFNYVNFSHISSKFEVKIFHNLHSMVLYYSMKEMRLMKTA